MAGEKSARKTTRKPKARAAAAESAPPGAAPKPSDTAKAEEKRLSGAGQPGANAMDPANLGAAMMNMLQQS